MNTLSVGIIVLVITTSIISFFMFMNLKNARAEGLKGIDLILRLLPFLIADAAFLLVFVLWYLRNS